MILNGKIPCEKVYESKYSLAFRDVYPKAPTHVLVIPKNKYVNFICLICLNIPNQ